MAELPRRADAVVIGGGVMGASTLHHLTAAGCTDVVLLERDTLGAGSTSKAAGGIRAQFSDEHNIRMALENIRRYERFGDEFGVDIAFHQWGYLILLGPGSLPRFRAALPLQQRLGVPSRLLTPEEAQAIVPQLRVDDLAGATFCPIDGYATPESVVQGYASAAIRRGARIVQGCDVRAITTEAGRVTGVDTALGPVSAPVVALTAGVWSVELAATVRLDLPVRAEARHVWLTEPGDPLPPELPLTIDFDTSFYFHREGESLLLGGREDTIEALAPAAMNRLPLLEDLGVRYGWWGYYEMSPDHNALIGAAGSPEGLLYATGFSGHGFQQAPAVGEHLAELALGHPPTFDLSQLSADRFARGAARPETHVV